MPSDLRFGYDFLHGSTLPRAVLGGIAAARGDSFGTMAPAMRPTRFDPGLASPIFTVGFERRSALILDRFVSY